MAITGYLSEFSLAELFRFLDQGYKTGLLTLKSEIDHPYYIWSHQGRIVAASRDLTTQGLVKLMQQRNILFQETSVVSDKMPLGLSLKAQNILDAEQLKMLFAIQVMRTVCKLFTIPNAWFRFDPEADIPVQEMTGLSAPATEITLAGLRALKDWNALADKLPLPNSSLVSKIEGNPAFRLNQQESQVWELVNGQNQIAQMAEILDLSLEKTQQTAFRLVVIGLAEEVPMPEADPDKTMVTDDVSESLSQSFLENLVNFLDHV